MRNVAEKVFDASKKSASFFSYWGFWFTQWAVRFLALPYYFLYEIDWKSCKISRSRALLDVLYIFFVLKTYPSHYSACRLWDVRRRDWPFYYGSIYDPAQKRRLKRKLNPDAYSMVYRDKWLCARLCEAEGLPVITNVALIKKDSCASIQELCADATVAAMPLGQYFAKPRTGKGGGGIVILVSQPSGVSPQDSLGNLIDGRAHLLAEDYVIQRSVHAHNELARFGDALHTVRVVSLLAGGRAPHLVGAYLKIAGEGSKVDNLSQGGLAVAVDLDRGDLAHVGIDRRGRELTGCTESGHAFAGTSLCMWAEVKELVVRSHRKVGYCGLLGFDIAITDSGPIIVEINDAPDTVDLESVCGPILRSPKVRGLFSEASLLYNNKQEVLAKS